MALRRWLATVIALLAGCFFVAGLGIYEFAVFVAGLQDDPTDGADLD